MQILLKKNGNFNGLNSSKPSTVSINVNKYNLRFEDDTLTAP